MQKGGACKRRRRRSCSSCQAQMAGGCGGRDAAAKCLRKKGADQSVPAEVANTLSRLQDASPVIAQAPWDEIGTELEVSRAELVATMLSNRRDLADLAESISSGASRGWCRGGIVFDPNQHPDSECEPSSFEKRRCLLGRKKQKGVTNGDSWESAGKLNSWRENAKHSLRWIIGTRGRAGCETQCARCVASPVILRASIPLSASAQGASSQLTASVMISGRENGNEATAAGRSRACLIFVNLAMNQPIPCWTGMFPLPCLRACPSSRRGSLCARWVALHCIPSQGKW